VSALRHYRDDGPLAELGGRLLGRSSTALPWTSAALLPLLAVLVVPAQQAPLALAAAALVAAPLAGRARAGAHAGRLDWLVPPLLRVAEYGALLLLAAGQGAATVPACYALLAALAYHHYDLVYRLRDRGESPPSWLRRGGLGWEGRLVAAAALAAADVLRPALYAAAVLLLVVYVAEGTLAWRRSERTPA
jgi:hypothetical protein